MLERNLFDEAARVLAMPIPRRKALTYVAAGFAGAMLPFLWPKRATAYEYDEPCDICSEYTCTGHKLDDYCRMAGGQSGHCVKQSRCPQYGRLAKCICFPGPPPDAPTISSIPDVAITREDSLAAENCQEGTDWVASWFPGRHSVSSREAAGAAIARGKPRLARYIAHTAHLVHRGAVTEISGT